MKKQIKILLLSIVLVLISTLTVNAADATATLSLDNSEVENGDTFTVTLNVACEEGINGLEGTVSYDKENLELVSIDVGDSNWSNLGEGLEIAILHAKSGTIKSADILKITFKVKDTAEVGTTAKVTLSDMLLDSDAAVNSSKEIGTKEIEVTITEEELENVTLTGIKITKEPAKTTYKVGEKFDKTGMVITAQYSDGTSKEITNWAYEPADELKLTDTKITITYTEGEVTKTVEQEIITENVSEDSGSEDKEPENKEPEDKDPTQADKDFDKAGLENITYVVITVMSVIAVVTYKKYRDYKNI